MKHVPDKFKKLTIVIPPPTDERSVAFCPGIRNKPDAKPPLTQSGALSSLKTHPLIGIFSDERCKKVLGYCVGL
jgi:hypothetical protein